MRWNPILIKELKIRSRVVRIPILLMFYNAIVALIAVFMFLTSMDIFNGSNYIDYSGMTSLFAGLGIFQCGVVFMLTLVVSANSISGEREKGTLDLMLVTPTSPATVIRGKLYSTIASGGLLIFSSMPVMAISTIYGGVETEDVLYLVGTLLFTMLYASSTGILCSSFSFRSSVAVVTTLIVEAALVIGPFILLSGISRIMYSGVQESMDIVISLGGWVFLLVINPAMPVMGFYDKLLGSSMIMDYFYYLCGIEEDTAFAYFLQKHFMQCCVGTQIILSIVFLWISVKKLGAQKKRKL